MKHKKLKISLISAAVAIFMLVASLTVYAYFTTRVYVYTEDGKEVAHVGMNLQLLFGKLDATVTAGTDLKIPSYNVVDASGADVTDDNGNWIAIAGSGQYLHYNDGVTYDPANNVDERTLYDPEAPWGSAQNPYVISESRHLQNLSALQSVGYFDMLYIGDNFTSGNYNEGSAAIPYFVICETDGTPVNIDGSEINVPIKPIGSAEHPFIGVIGGAFVDGTATVEGKQTGASAIHNFQVKTNTNQIDVGLFGFIGFMGKEPTAEDLAAAMENNTSYVPQFEGVFSSIQNVLISDVSVTVSQPTLTEGISELFMPFWDAFFGNSNGKVDDGEVLHRFTYTDKGATEIPHETHHIGIFAGHVSYALMNNISVYYSDDNTYAIDLTATDLDKDNYYSASGILGMMYNMNCTISNKVENNVVVGNCVVTMGTGTSNDEINTGGGTGTGGGALSGNGRGYVTAAEIFTDFNNVAVQMDSNNELLWRYRTSVGGAWSQPSVLILKSKDGTSYTSADGTTEAEVSGTSVTVDGKTITNFFIREIYQDTAGQDMIRYRAPDGTIVTECEMLGNDYNGQTIWKYSAGGDGIWHYGIRVLKSGDTYKLEDGTTVNFDAANCEISNDTTAWNSFFITETVDGTDISYMFDPATGTNWPVTAFERKPMTLIEAYRINAETNAREDLCIQWMRERLIPFIQPNPEPTGLYYFYDGVFTFGLSSPEDTVRDTWENNETPTLYLGANNADAWEVNPQRGNKALVSLLKPVTNNKELDLAIQEGKQFYITAQPTTTDAYLMSLLTTNTTDNKPGPITGQALQLENTLREDLWQSYYGGVFHNLPTAPKTGAADRTMTVEVQNADGTLSSREVTLADLKTEAFWNNYTVLNVGRTSAELPLDQLKVKYNVAASKLGDFAYFRDDTGALVEPDTDAGTVSTYEYWDGYFCYEWSSNVVSVSALLGIRRRDYTVNYYYQSVGNGERIYLGSSTAEGNGSVAWTDPEVNFQYSYVDISRFALATQTYSNVSLYTAYNYDVYSKTISAGEVMWFNPNATTDDKWEETAEAPIVNLTDNRFHVDGATGGVNTTPAAVVVGSIVAYSTGTPEPYYYYDMVDGKYYFPGSADPIDQTTGEEAGAILLNRYPLYNFSDSSQTSFLQILNQFESQDWLGQRGNEYSIWAGTGGPGLGGQYEQLAMEKNQSKDGILVFEKGQQYCYIRYALDNAIKYVSYSYNAQNLTAEFNGVNTTSEATKMYVYIIEGVIDMDFGVNTFIPKDIDAENSTSHALSAGDVVLWPQMTLTQGGYNSNTGYKTTITPTTSNAINASKYVTPDPTYSIIPLVGEGGLNWGDENGYFLGANGAHGLDKKFQMADQSDFGPMINIGDIAIPIGGTNTMVAPVGSNGVKATIPKGCVAFRVNAGGTQTIRVIVAVPTTDYYLGETGFDLDHDMDYYIGVWQVEAAGEALLSNFDKADAVEKFELPRSYSFNFNDSPTDVEGTNSHVVVEYEGQEYRTYLNGDCFLVAYEFTVSGEGVYVIGSVHGDENTSSGKDVPMEIVHFSVSGTASAGRDGVTGNQLGAIDFVYDDTVNSVDTIITVDRTGLTGGTPNTGNTENYANYYASHCLLYTNNEAMDVTKGMVWVRRYISVTNGAGTTILSYKVGELNSSNTLVQTEAFLGKQYAVNADELELRPIP